MYKTKIAEPYREEFKRFWWDGSDETEYTALMTMGRLTLLYCEETGLLIDIYNNKLETFRKVGQLPEIVVEAKNLRYADIFDLHEQYVVVGYEWTGKPMLRIRDVAGEEYMALPSRLRVVSIKEQI